MAKGRYKFEKYVTSPEKQEHELRRLFGCTIQATIAWAEEGAISAETANHRISCLQDFMARMGKVPATAEELKNWKNPDMQLSIFG